MHGTGPSNGEDHATFNPSKKHKHDFSLFHPVLSRVTRGTGAKRGALIGTFYSESVQDV